MTDCVSLNPSTTEPLEHNGMLMLKALTIKAEVNKKIISLAIFVLCMVINKYRSINQI